MCILMLRYVIFLHAQLLFVTYIYTNSDRVRKIGCGVHEMVQQAIHLFLNLGRDDL
jgi:hypothetical protein